MEIIKRSHFLYLIVLMSAILKWDVAYQLLLLLSFEGFILRRPLLHLLLTAPQSYEQPTGGAEEQHPAADHGAEDSGLWWQRLKKVKVCQLNGWLCFSQEALYTSRSDVTRTVFTPITRQSGRSPPRSPGDATCALSNRTLFPLNANPAGGFHRMNLSCDSAAARCFCISFYFLTLQCI